MVQKWTRDVDTSSVATSCVPTVLKHTWESLIFMSMWHSPRQIWWIWSCHITFFVVKSAVLFSLRIPRNLVCSGVLLDCSVTSGMVCTVAVWESGETSFLTQSTHHEEDVHKHLLDHAMRKSLWKWPRWFCHHGKRMMVPRCGAINQWEEMYLSLFLSMDMYLF